MMNKIFNLFADNFDWFLPLMAMAIWFGISSRWEAYTRKKNYQELIALNELREKSIITQVEFDAKKEDLLSA
jgi:hypothetical protein